MQLQHISTKIHEIRGIKTMLYYDLAELYNVETKRLKESVKRNIGRFPEDFMFELTRNEYNSLRSQNASLEKGQGKHSKFNPYAFTEQGVAMLSSILNSNKAIEMNIQIVRSFVLLRQFALSHREITEKLNELENKFNQRFHTIYEAIDYLMKKDTSETKQKNRKRIGFKQTDDF